MRLSGLLLLASAVLAAQSPWDESMARGTQALQKGTYSEARREFESARQRAQDRAQQAMALVRLGMVSEREQRFDLAQEFFEGSLGLREQEFGPDHLEVAASLDHLARALQAQGRVTEAEERQGRAMAIRARRIAAESTEPPPGGAGEVLGKETDRAPRLEHRVDPKYSEEARLARHQGRVELAVEIGPDGRPYRIRLEKGLGLGLDEQAVEAVRQWQFQPGVKGGKPVTVRTKISVHFRLL